jgi:hypothetical protein
MKESILDKVCKCKQCGKAYLDGIEGDSSRCDYCIAEDEIRNKEDGSTMESVP